MNDSEKGETRKEAKEEGEMGGINQEKLKWCVYSNVSVLYL